MSSGAPSGELGSCVRRARAGDRGAFRALHHRYARAVHAVLLASVPSQEAEDLAQEVFLTAWQRLGEVRRDERFGAWLLAVARNRARRHLARRARGTESLPDELAAPEPADGGAAEVLAALRALPESYRETLAMRLVEGMSGPEIAEATGLSPGSVRVKLCRGMRLLRERLRREGIA